MATYGVTGAGFIRKSLSQIKADITTRLQADFGENVDFSEDGPFGQLIADLAAAVDEGWQVSEDVFDSFDPDAASGARLVSLCAITGTVPKTPTRSAVAGVAIGTNGKTVPAGTQVQVAGSGPIFRTKADALIATLAAWGAGAVVAGDLRTNVGNVYRCITGGVSAAAGPTTTSLDYTDGGGVVHWRYLGAGTAAVYDNCESVDFGDFSALAGTLTVIVNPVAGLVSFTNPLDSSAGQSAETDAQLRARREQELAAQGEGGIESLRADLLKVTGVKAALVFENATDAVDGDGLEPHSVECVVLGGLDADVAAVVFQKGAGIRTHGSTTVVVTDSQGFTHDVKFSRPTQKLIHVLVNLTKDPATYPADGDAQVAAALVDFATGKDWVQAAGLGSGYKVGDDVVDSKLYAPVFDRVSGVADITKMWISIDPVNPPVSAANLAIGSRELAVFDTSRITVVSI